MKAIVLSATRTIERVELLEPQPGPDDVLIEVHYVGLCGSDLNSYRGSYQLVSYPRIPGHEVSGVVINTGERVPDGIQTGDQVTLSPYSECGVCPACRAGRPNCCQFNQTLGLQREGALSERFAIHYGKVVKSRSLALDELVLVEPLSVGYHAANRGRVSEADTVLVIGCGTIGIGVIAGAARKGATVIGVDVDAHKLRTAQRFGAQHTLDSGQPDLLDRIAELTGGEGVNVAIEAVGLPETYRLAIAATAYAGRVVYVGYAKEPVCYDTTDFVRKELDILGARNSLRVFPAVVKMLEGRERPFRELITRVYPLEQTAQAFRDWDAAPGQFTKLLIDVRA